MNDPKNVYENLKHLLVELQKVKELNNLANEYKIISANLILSLQDYLKDSHAFSDAFNDYLLQTNKTVEETKDSLDSVLNSINCTVNAFCVADGTIDKKVDALSVRLSRLEQQTSQIESLYEKCLTIEGEIRRDTESFISKTADTISNQNNRVIGKMDALPSSLANQISQANQSLIEHLSISDDKTKAGFEQNRQFISQILNGIRQTSERISELNNLMEQRHNLLQLYQNQLQDEHKKISIQSKTMHDDLVVQVAQLKRELVSTVTSNKLLISREIGSVKSFQKVTLSLLVIIIVSVIILVVI